MSSETPGSWKQLQDRADRILSVPGSEGKRVLFFYGVKWRDEYHQPNVGCFNQTDGLTGTGRFLTGVVRSPSVRVQSTLNGLRRGIQCSSLAQGSASWSAPGWRLDPYSILTEVHGGFLSLDHEDYGDLREQAPRGSFNHMFTRVVENRQSLSAFDNECNRHGSIASPILAFITVTEGSIQDLCRDMSAYQTRAVMSFVEDPSALARSPDDDV